MIYFTRRPGWPMALCLGRRHCWRTCALSEVSWKSSRFIQISSTNTGNTTNTMYLYHVFRERQGQNCWGWPSVFWDREEALHHPRRSRPQEFCPEHDRRRKSGWPGCPGQWDSYSIYFTVLVTRYTLRYYILDVDCQYPTLPCIRHSTLHFIFRWSVLYIFSNLTVIKHAIQY